MSKLFPIILILASVGVFWGYVNPAYSADTGSVDNAGRSVKELQSVVADYTDALSKTAEIERIRTGLLSKFNAIQPANLEKIAKLLPDHIDSVRLIIDINNIAAKHGMSLSKINLTGPSGQQPASGAPVVPTVSSGPQNAGFGPDISQYDSVKLGFVVSGTYDNFIPFLKELEQSLRVVEVVSLAFSGSGQTASVSGASQSSPNGIFTYTMTIKTYYLK